MRRLKRRIITAYLDIDIGTFRIFDSFRPLDAYLIKKKRDQKVMAKRPMAPQTAAAKYWPVSWLCAWEYTPRRS